MEKRKLFLSRVTTEFAELTNELRALGNHEFPMLDIYDQENPPGEAPGGAAKITVAKIYAWIKRSTHVFHYVGIESGACAKVPEDELQTLSSFLDPRSQTLLASLLCEFEKSSLNSSALTYTHLEGIVAIALDREPLVFQIESEPAFIANSQRAYRSWLRTNYLQGRDRVSSSCKSDFRDSTLRTFKLLNTQATLERLARSAAETPLWESVLTLSQPETTDNAIEKHSKELRAFSGSIAVDWVHKVIECGERKAPPLLYKGLDKTHGSVARTWLLPFDHEIALLSNRSGTWTSQSVAIAGNDLRAACFDDGHFWALSEHEGAYSLTPLEGSVARSSNRVRGFATHHFESMRLFRDASEFFITSGGNTWRLSQDADAGIPFFRAEPSESPGSGSSMVLPLFPERSAFPFRRYFSGETYEASYDHPKWALIKVDGHVRFITLCSGEFLDAFRMVDVKLEGVWNWQDIHVNAGVVALDIRRDSDAREMTIPLFPDKEITQYWDMKLKSIPIFQSNETGRQLRSIGPVQASNIEPFCFVERTLAAAAGEKETRFRTWLIPEIFRRELVERLKEFLCGLRPLPATPICNEASLSTITFNDSWWQLLWTQCH